MVSQDHLISVVFSIFILCPDSSSASVSGCIHLESWDVHEMEIESVCGLGFQEHEPGVPACSSWVNGNNAWRCYMSRPTQTYKKMRRCNMAMNKQVYARNQPLHHISSTNPSPDSVMQRATLQVLDFVNLGSPLSLRSPARLENCGNASILFLRFNQILCWEGLYSKWCKVLYT
jgi:hypothetical protein